MPSNTNIYKEVGTIGGYLPEIAANTIQILEKPQAVLGGILGL